MPYIFTANSGRCGSLYLACLLEHLTGIPSRHEPVPWMIGQTLKELNDGNASRETLFVLDQKIAQIRRDASRLGYIETNQQFIKCYADRVLDEFEDVYCIYLYRNPLDVIISYGEKLVGLPLDWFLQPHWERNAWRSEQPMRSYYDIVLYNWYEVRERYFRYKPKFTKTYELSFEDLNNLPEIYRMLRHFNVAYKVPTDMESLPQNSLVKSLTQGQQKTRDEIISDMRRNWHVEGTEWRFPSDYIQLQHAQLQVERMQGIGTNQ